MNFFLHQRVKKVRGTDVLGAEGTVSAFHPGELYDMEVVLAAPIRHPELLVMIPAGHPILVMREHWEPAIEPDQPAEEEPKSEPLEVIA